MQVPPFKKTLMDAIPYMDFLFGNEEGKWRMGCGRVFHSSPSESWLKNANQPGCRAVGLLVVSSWFAHSCKAGAFAPNKATEHFVCITLQSPVLEKNRKDSLSRAPFSQYRSCDPSAFPAFPAEFRYPCMTSCRLRLRSLPRVRAGPPTIWSRPCNRTRPLCMPELWPESAAKVPSDEIHRREQVTP
eukprot:1146265-Pelagomonas_calceolata.AAC.1